MPLTLADVDYFVSDGELPEELKNKFKKYDIHFCKMRLPHLGIAEHTIRR